MVEKVETDLYGFKFSIETGRLAKQASGSVLVSSGDTAVLVAVTVSQEPKDTDFFPLTVEYRERSYAAGKIPGGFIKREGRPTTKEILVSRLIDRPVRPLFPDGFRNEVQIVPQVLSADNINPPDILAMIGSSAALAISDIPFNGPTGAVRVGKIDDQYIINPKYELLEKSSINLIVAGTKNAITMVESFSSEVSENDILKALEFGHEAIKQIIAVQETLVAKCGKPKREIPLFVIEEEIDKAVREYITQELKDALRIKEKLTLYSKVDELKNKTSEYFVKIFPEKEKDVLEVFSKVESELFRSRILNEKIRSDGRDLKEVRPISIEIGVLPRTHGSGLFTRGETQALVIATLGTSVDEQIIDDIEGDRKEHFLLHYNFPPFSVGETGRFVGPGRREIGHGHLAEMALRPVIPNPEQFPYTIRIVSEILESNGSSSMATVCGGSLCMMDAGIPIKSPVAGVAMGLIKEENKTAILTDIMGIEDHLGDMDFKVAGTEKGITALQMDIKIEGITFEIIKQVLLEAYHGRMFVLEKMNEVISAPRQELSSYAPRITTFYIDKDKIRDVIGPGGKAIKNIIEETGVKIDIEDDGKIVIASIDEKGTERALEMIKYLTEDAEVGKIYLGKVMRIVAFGAFVEVLPGKEGLVHISKLAEHHVKEVTDVVKEGDEILVKVIEIDKQGRINLSRKDAISESEKDKNKKNQNK
ncbi:MAG: polyribonucleotide nucleotidyltransferase [Candidatus Firestonebacteria bacterium]|nr:polyribonucleotide nucleotidyltransferase [Candidatus Firestonebacteria bacterium]